MSRVFISYRRDDHPGLTGRIYDRLVEQFGEANVFMDVDAIGLGLDFREQISSAVNNCDVLLAVIGNRWNYSPEREERRLDNPQDFVRIEIGAALSRGIPVIPLLIDNARIPKEAELPSDLQGLVYRNGLKVDVGADFRHNVNRLIGHLKTLLSANKPSVERYNPTPVLPAPVSVKVLWRNKEGGFFLYLNGKAIHNNRASSAWVDDDLLVYDPESQLTCLCENFRYRDDNELREAKVIHTQQGALWRNKEGKFFLYLRGKALKNDQMNSSWIDDDLLAYDPETQLTFVCEDFRHRNDNQLREAKLVQ